MLLLIFFLLGLIAALIICLCAGYTGLALVGLLLLFTLLCTVGVVLLYIIFLLILGFFTDRSKKEHTADSKLHRFLLVNTVRILPVLFRIRIHAENLELVPQETFFFAGNHRSGFDPILVICALPKRIINFVTKPSIFKIPLIPPYLRRCGFLSINREDDREALRTILAVSQCLKEGRASFGIYPEGTRSRSAEMLPFRNGCFKAAQRAKVPVLVGSVQGSDQIFKNFPWRSTDVTLRFCGVIPAEEAAALKTNELGDRVRAMLEESLSK